MNLISSNSVDGLYFEAWNLIEANGRTEQSRNGVVYSIPWPVMMELYDPSRRVLHDEVRRCNHAFHIAEVVWMLSGSQNVDFVTAFNSRYREYADPDGTVWGAYGHRWLVHFGLDQISEAIMLLQRDHKTRQVVIGMWDPWADLGEAQHNDRPCNTQIMLRIVEGSLDMLVTNRSNDLVWGALGANVVHFTYLQELIALSLGVDVGTYRVVTNNLHVYHEMPRFDEIRKSAQTRRMVPHAAPYPILLGDDTWDKLRVDCGWIVNRIVAGNKYISPDSVDTQWCAHVAIPVINGYLAGPGPDRIKHWEDVGDPNWKKVLLEQWG